MTRLPLILLVVIWPICTSPVQAQLFRKKAPTPPAQRVPELVMALKTSPDERQRSSAAEDLREFDTQAYTEIVPALVNAATRDPKVNVRMEAITTLGKLRPVTREAGQALEHAASEDSNLRVRVHARTTLWKYQLSGYSDKTPAADATKRRTTEEPPIYEPPPTLLPPTAAPPAEAPPAKAAPVKPVEPPRPLPKGPAFSTAVPAKPITTRPAPDKTVVEDDLPPLPKTPAPALAPPLPLPKTPAAPILTPPLTPPSAAPSGPPRIEPPVVAPPLPEAPPLALPPR